MSAIFRKPVRSLVAAVVLVAVVGVTGSATAGAEAAAHVDDAATTVDYAGFTVPVPTGWPVYRLTPDSTTCVRFDVHALYLGHPGDNQLCAGHIVGTDDVIQIEPIDTVSSPRITASTLTLAPGASLPADAFEAGPGRVTVVLAGSNLFVTAGYRAEASTVRSVIDTLSAQGVGSAPQSAAGPAAGPAAGSTTAPASPQAAPSLAAPPTTAAAGGTSGAAQTAPQMTAAATSPSPLSTAHHVVGYGFDACGVPSASTMAKWATASPYQTAGLYLGGVNVGCPSGTLTASSVSNMLTLGWNIMPIYVGLQAPLPLCPGNGCAGMSTTLTTAASQGQSAGTDAARLAAAAGFVRGNIIYFDMEGYQSPATNTAPVMAFLSAWSLQLHALGYLSGVYSSASSGVKDLVAYNSNSGFTPPDGIWFASWPGSGYTSVSDPNIPANLWVSGRVHQYSGGHNETYSGATINIDSNRIDGLVNGVNSDSSFIEAVYADFVGRPPTGTELQNWTTQFRNGVSHGVLVTTLATSTAWSSQIVAKLYTNTLGRAPDATGLAYWAGLISSGKSSVAAVAANFYASPEYFANIGGGTNTSWVTDLYKKILMRSADTAGLNYWVQVAQTQGRGAVASAFYQSIESRMTRVTGLYLGLLHRVPDAAGQSYWAGIILSQGDLVLAETLAVSPEYAAVAATRFD